MSTAIRADPAARTPHIHSPKLRILRGWSIGFIPIKATRLPGPNGRSGLWVSEWDLMEYSAVPIPENPQALTVAIQKGLVRDPSLRDWLSWLPNRRDVLCGLVAERE